MARKTMSAFAASCHKLFPATILIALLISSYSHTSLAQLSGSASANANGSTDLAASTTSLNAGAEASSGGGLQASGSIGGVSGSLSIGGLGLNGAVNANASASGSGGSSLSLGGSASTGSSIGQARVSAFVSSTPKPEGLLSKLKDVVKSTVGLSSEKKENSMQISGNAVSGGSSTLGSGPIMSASGSASAGGSGSGSSSSSAQASAEMNNSNQNAGLLEKIGDVAKRGKDIVKDTARELKQDVKNMANSDASSSNNSDASAGGSVKIGGNNVSASVQVGVDNKKDEGLMSKMMHKVEDKASEFGKEVSKTKENVRSKLMDSQEDKSVAVQVLDKVAEVAKKPVESVLKPLDKALGYQRDPLVKMFDESHELLRKPLSTIAKPVEKVFTGAFKTSDEARKESEKNMNAQERQNSKLAEERIKKGTGRSVLGDISDRTVELYEKPFEIVLKPVDRVLGLDKDGKKNPLIRIIDGIYGLSKKPVDALAKPFESILKKMADGDQAYQVSVRFNADTKDPKLFTRLADGALNIADRIITKPIDLAMRPLGYGDRKKSKNPIVDAAHSLKNATRIGIELFTRPLDRIIKEIAEIGAIKDDAQREAELERKRQEASRIVRALDKFTQYAQTPWEIVLRPVSKLLGYSREGRKEPLLRVWDVVHQVVRAPLQVFSKPVEDAILGEQKRQSLTPRDKAAVKAAANVGGEKKNLFVQGIKKVERLAAKPLEIITSPIRRLILGEDGKVRSKTSVGVNHGKAQPGSDSESDTIVETIEHMNNVALKPFQILTQPISDILSSDSKDNQQQQSQKKVEVKAQVHESSPQSSQSSQQRGGQQVSATATAQIKG